MAKPKNNCEKCKKPTPKRDLETVEIMTSRQTHWDPAEYEDQEWCGRCRTEPEGDYRSADDYPGWED